MEGLADAVSEGSPEPFDGAELKIAEPNATHGELERPDCEDEAVKVDAVPKAELGEAVAVKEGGRNEGLHQVVGEGHAADGLQCLPTEPAGCLEPEEQAGVAGGDE